MTELVILIRWIISIYFPELKYSVCFSFMVTCIKKIELFLKRNAPPTHISLLWEYREYIHYCKGCEYILSQTYSEFVLFIFFCKYHNWNASSTIISVVHVLCIYTLQWWKLRPLLLIFQGCGDGWCAPTWKPAPNTPPQLLQSWKQKVVFTQEECFSALVLIIGRFIVEDKLYHAPFTAWLSTPRGLRYLFELMRDIMERFRSCHRCVTRHSATVRSIKKIKLPSTD